MTSVRNQVYRIVGHGAAAVKRRARMMSWDVG
jgi:hypothetical protein